ncbi:MAG: serine hydrolase [Saprospiraceae bacterium]|nr:serine hydrolase [Saprospiraceae bacterium]
MRQPFLIFVFYFLLTSFANAQSKPSFLNDFDAAWVEAKINSMTLDEKIGQLLMPRGNLSGRGYDIPKLEIWVKDYKIGGLVFFAGNPVDQATLTNHLQSLSKIPLLIGEDFEWGLAMRMENTDRFPYQMTLGAMDKKNGLIEEMGAEIGRQCRRLGVHINYAPVVDINNNPNNPVINFRSFGEDRNSVTLKSLAYMKGLQSQKVISTAKHFPGHGDTDVDSHYDLPVVRHSIKRLDSLELFPFKTLIENGLSGIMTAHLSVPSLDTTTNLAATLSQPVIDGLLRKKLGFEGLIFTDAMDMKGIVNHFPNGEAIVRALMAGNDIIETFEDVPTAFLAIQNAIKEGRITVQDIDAKVRRILQAKSWVGLDKYVPVPLENLVEDLNTIQSDVLNREFAEASVTLLRNENEILPFKDLTKKIAIISIDSDGKSDFQKMASLYSDASNYVIPSGAGDSIVNVLAEVIKSYDIQIIALHLKNNRSAAKYSLTDANLRTFEILMKNARNPIVCIFGNAYVLDKLPVLQSAKAITTAYQMTTYTEEATAMAIFGANPFQGKLPVTVSDNFIVGTGIPTKATGVLSYGVPEMAGLDRKLLNTRLDSIVNAGLAAQAYPGAVLQVSKDGRVIFKKAYGHHTYESASEISGDADGRNDAVQLIMDVMDELPVESVSDKNDKKISTFENNRMQTDDIFDLASVTKISASALAVMQLMSVGKFDPDAYFYQYVPELSGTSKAFLKWKDMQTHRSGLKAWIPFWKYAIDTVQTVEKAIKSDPLLEQSFIVNIKKRGFFKKLFGIKPSKVIDIAGSFNRDPLLLDKCLNKKSITWKKHSFSSEESDEFSIQISDNLWMHEDFGKIVYNSIASSTVNSQQGYVYSDLHYYYYPAMVQFITGISWKKYLNNTYKSIGANTLTYNPLEKFSKEKIVPTEVDSVFRGGLIHGRVHDEGAAMTGGISGHAGLFGNANDLMKIMQMYLQKGWYGGQRYIQPEIVDLCTRYQYPGEENRRGIIFDKPALDDKTMNAPTLASTESYGHSGYTGTYTWVDPVHNLVYVFLSNRVYPTRNNNKINEMKIRQEIGDAIYKTISESKIKK